jgi:hypothetical protein
MAKDLKVEEAAAGLLCEDPPRLQRLIPDGIPRGPAGTPPAGLEAPRSLLRGRLYTISPRHALGAGGPQAGGVRRSYLFFFFYFVGWCIRSEKRNGAANTNSFFFYSDSRACMDDIGFVLPRRPASRIELHLIFPSLISIHFNHKSRIQLYDL